MITYAELLSRFAFEDIEASDARIALRVRIGSRARHRSVTFAELARSVSDAASGFRGRGGHPGQRIALLMPHSEKLVTWFLGALFAGMVPCIVAWPTAKMDPEKYRRNLLSIVESLRADWLLTEPAMAEQLGSALGNTVVVAPDSIVPTETGRLPALNETGAAFIQFSGGTTGNQKSVPISFELLHRQIESYSACLGLMSTDRIVSWLPLYHDMGLVACLLIPFALRLPVSMFAPMEWVMDPWPFLHAIGEDSATLGWLPNFAFSFLASRPAKPDQTLDLSSLRALINCSEPIRAESMDAFAHRFGPHGFSANAMHSCYAMAEATFAVTQTSSFDPPRRLRVSREAFVLGIVREDANGTRTLISCGPAVPGTEVRVVDADDRPCDPGVVGMIDIRGPSVMAAYLDVDRNAEGTFVDGWYRTGDLGALVEGHLYVTGRKKDLIIVGGVNVYPEDIEVAVSALDGLRPGRTVAIGLADDKMGTERLVVVAEAINETILEQSRALESEVRKITLMTSGIAPNRVFIVPPNWIVKSTAGKIARAETRQRVLTRWSELTGENQPANT